MAGKHPPKRALPEWLKGKHLEMTAPIGEYLESLRVQPHSKTLEAVLADAKALRRPIDLGFAKITKKSLVTENKKGKGYSYVVYFVEINGSGTVPIRLFEANGRMTVDLRRLPLLGTKQMEKLIAGLGLRKKFQRGKVKFLKYLPFEAEALPRRSRPMLRPISTSLKRKPR